jgi:S-DNA-T family DNA segregation ATPase FtsK/SpoIIIE
VNEFSIYKNLGKRFTAPNIEKTVFTNDLDEIAVALQSLCDEMKRRQTLFDKANCRNIQEYNANKKPGSADYLPRIVVVIDEFVDILKNKSSEGAILELVRKARAQGIHLIVATQRPSAKVISGDITENFPARIAFKATKRQNSDIILGESGAEKLIGKGDMLFLNNSEKERLQGAFVDTEEVKDIINFTTK